MNIKNWLQTTGVAAASGFGMAVLHSLALDPASDFLSWSTAKPAMAAAIVAGTGYLLGLFQPQPKPKAAT